MAPRLRKDLVATTADEHGVACVEVTDPVGGTAFRFYDFEYALAQQFNGQPLEDVVAWAHDNYEIELSNETLDQFLEKLAGLGFLEGSSSGAQPAILAPYSQSSGSHAFGDLPTTVAVDRAAVDMAAADMASVDEPSDTEPPEPIQPPGRHWTQTAVAPSGADAAAPAAAPERFISGDATEYRLREAGSGLWERAGGAAGMPPVPEEPLALLPKLEILAGPLPPVFVHAPAEAAAFPAPPRAPARTTAVVSPSNPAPPRESAANVSVDTPFATPLVTPFATPLATPLGSVAHAFAESIAPSAGVLDADSGGATLGSDGGDARGAAAGEPQRPSAASAVRASWAADVADEVDGADGDRRQPPPPEVVVMPPLAEAPGGATPPRRRSYAGVVLLLLIGGVGGALWWFLRPQPVDDAPAPAASSAEAAPRVHVVSPQPTTFYKWFEATGLVTTGKDEMLSFRVGGRVRDTLPPGTTFVAGESIARLYGVIERELSVNRLRSRVAFYEQLRDSSRAEGAEAAALQAETKLAARRQELAAAQAALSEWEIRPRVSGEIAQVLAPKGSLVKAGAPVFRVRSAGPRATFALSAEDAARARASNFCRVETIPGTGGGAGGNAGVPTESGGARAIDCKVSAGIAASAPASRLAVDLVGAAGVVPDTQVRLASARYDGVFPVPRAGLVREGSADTAAHVWVVSGGGRFAERRTVEVVDTVDDLALVAHGIAVGDAVLVDPPATLKAGSEINVAR
ncbi:MAG: hypothetical protein H7X95_07685 [Deltaproteobacteria bacterium]|nr:hypothetical protein [Deltaproteobacteria bacterium]